MIRFPGRTTLAIAAGFIATVLISAGALYALLGPTGQVTEHVSGPVTRQLITQSSPTATVRPTPRPSPPSVKATPSPTPTSNVTLSIGTVKAEKDQGGVAVTIDLANQRSTPLDFAFDPAFDVHVQDASGKTWPLRWAEYHGAEHVASQTSLELTHAFFSGSVENPGVWPLTVSVEHVRGASRVQWRVAKDGTTTSVVIHQQVVALPTIAPGPVSLTVTNPLPNPALGGVQVDLLVHNQTTSDLTFQFSPNDQITAEDNLNRPYQVRWAQYDGIVRVAPGATVRLARMFLSGPIATGNPAWLSVTVHQVPGAKTVRGVVSVQ